jgi:carboxymethylenebutenolidase
MRSERTTITTPDGQFGAYVARPDSDNAPAVVVLQEIFGVNSVMREITDGLAGQGYLAICPDLFWRIDPGIDITDLEMDRALQLMSAFNVHKGMTDIQATIDFIRADPECSGKVGAVGFCLGGMLAYLTACRTDTDATVGYYAVSLDSHLSEADAIKRPLMLHIAEEDGFVPKDAQAKVREALEPNPLVTIHSYPGREHAFARPGGKHYDATDAERAGRRSLDFLKANLG